MKWWIWGAMATALLGGPKAVEVTQEDRKEALEVHNAARREVGVEVDLAWSPNLAAQAQRYAETLARSGRFEHAPDVAEGENLFWFEDSEQARPAAEASEGWYAEKADYRYGPVPARAGRKMVGHYTQMVWRETREVGIGMARSKHGLYVVARYSPAGNIVGEKPY